MNSGFIEADNISLLAFSALAFFMFCILLYSARRIDFLTMKGRAPLLGSVQLGLIVIIGLFSAIVSSGITREYFFPVVPLLFIGVIVVCAWLSFSKFGLALGRSFTLQALIGFQCFRIPLEVILHHWSNLGTVPVTMTWTGQNYDIISGLVAIFFAPLISGRKFLAWIPTVIGVLLLLNVLRVVVMSSPFPFSWSLDNPLQLIMHMPYALIVPLCVAPALIGHLVVIRLLVRGEEPNTN